MRTVIPSDWINLFFINVFKCLFLAFVLWNASIHGITLLYNDITILYHIIMNSSNWVPLNIFRTIKGRIILPFLSLQALWRLFPVRRTLQLSILRFTSQLILQFLLLHSLHLTSSSSMFFFRSLMAFVSRCGSLLMSDIWRSPPLQYCKNIITPFL